MISNIWEQFPPPNDLSSSKAGDASDEKKLVLLRNETFGCVAKCVHAKIAFFIQLGRNTTDENGVAERS
jgi:hypothetical protein